MSEKENRYPYGSIAKLSLFFTIITMVIVFLCNHPQAYTTNEIHAYETLANNIITKGIINLTTRSSIDVNEATDTKDFSFLHYDKIEITQVKDNHLMLNIINDKLIIPKYNKKYCVNKSK